MEALAVGISSSRIGERGEYHRNRSSADRLGYFVQLGARRFEIALRFAPPGRDPTQGEAVRRPARPLPGERLVERQRGLAGLAGRDPHIARGGERAVVRRVFGMAVQVGRRFRRRRPPRRATRPCSPPAPGTSLGFGGRSRRAGRVPVRRRDGKGDGESRDHLMRSTRPTSSVRIAWISCGSLRR